MLHLGARLGVRRRPTSTPPTPTERSEDTLRPSMTPRAVTHYPAEHGLIHTRTMTTSGGHIPRTLGTSRTPVTHGILGAFENLCIRVM
jgi:hypothetical protein